MPHILNIDLSLPAAYVSSGNFTAPGSEWMHQESLLLDYELFLVTANTLYIEYADKKYEVPENSYLLLPPLPSPYNIRRGYRASATSFLWIHFKLSKPAVLSAAPHEFIPSQEQRSPVISLPLESRLSGTGKLSFLFDLLQSSDPGAGPVLRKNYLCSLILLELADRIYSSSLPKSLPTAGRKLSADLTAYIRTHIRSRLRVSELAGVFGYNEKYLSTVFRREMGITIKAFIRNEQLLAANTLLSSGTLSVREISEAFGFPDARSFSKQYKKITGLTPSEYRSACRKDQNI